MTRVFADTFYWVAITDEKDAAFEQAMAFRSDVSDYVISTTEEVLTEYLNYFAEWGPRWRFLVAENIQRIIEAPMIRILPQSEDSFRAGLELYRARLDKGYSLTDCISMVAMRREGIHQVLTGDEHFEQDGFRALFRERR